MDDPPQVYRQGKLTFIVTPKKTMVQTTLKQTFILEPRRHYWYRRLRLINTMIRLGEIRDLNELSEWCGRGIMWTSTDYPIKIPEEIRC